MKTIIGAVAVGKVELIIEHIESDGTVNYRVEGPVVDHFGNRAIPGRVWCLQKGRCSLGLADVQARYTPDHLKTLSYNIYDFRGSADMWPYKFIALDGA